MGKVRYGVLVVFGLRDGGSEWMVWYGTPVLSLAFMRFGDGRGVECTCTLLNCMVGQSLRFVVIIPEGGHRHRQAIESDVVSRIKCV